ncbi:magnesium/cobalt transporter CorA [Pedosphaera parvula]|uniref:Magnesium transport protein CorA n=1 Tax=Pedosphaera parvula (strain Ellin514) TaxID=320771 RepID=B9XR33_PEDPL|nr:magnesium/cobalt transporter CorA [Pedosphaera parvula]EEF57729.1 magnesium and cobalt transport protein CorA [Pedosphaera parvula Ellin514]
MIRSFAFTTQGKLHSKDFQINLMPSLLADASLFLWVDLEKATGEESRQILDEVFHFHPLSIEDCIAESPTPKVEEYNPGEYDRFASYLFMVIHAVDYSRKNGFFATKELNFFLGEKFLVTYHDVPLQPITSAEELCLKGATHVARSPDRIAHTLLDYVVDHYNPALNELSEEMANVEAQALQNPNKKTLNTILRLKKKVNRLRQIMGPQRDVMARVARGEFKVIHADLVPYYRDVYDGLVRISELAQSYTDSLTGILQVYLNMSSNQTGEVVKLLTLITVITTPLMMIGTWYGMNFKDMPELSWRHAYPIAGGIMILSTGATYWYFKKKKWF